MGRAGWIGAAMLAWCLGSAGVVPAEAATPWRYGILEPKSDAGIFEMITRFAPKFGIDLQLVPVKSDAIGLKALIAGDLQAYDGALTGTVVAASKGVDVKLLGCQWPGQPLGVFVRAGIATASDLKDKTMAISTPFSNPDVIARAFLAEHDIPDTAMHFANLGGDVDRYKALVAGLADASVISAEYVPIAAKAGIRLLEPGARILPNYMRLCLFVMGKTLAARPQDTVHFMAADMSGLSYALAHRDETLALTRQITGAKPDDPRPGYIFDDSVRNHAIDPSFALPMNKIQWNDDQLLRQGNLTAPFDIKRMIDPAIREQAQALIDK